LLASGGYWYFSVGKILLTDIFRPILPAIITPDFTSNFVMLLGNFSET